MYSFVKNVLVGSGGVLIASLISIGLLPFVTRIYNPAEIGIWQLILTSATLIIPLSTWRMETAIVLERDNDVVNDIYSFIIVGTLAGIFVTAILLYVLRLKLVQHFELSSQGVLLYVPLLIGSLAMHKIGSNILVRNEMFGVLAVAKILSAFILPAISLLLAYIDTPRASYYAIGGCSVFIFQACIHFYSHSKCVDTLRFQFSFIRFRELYQKYSAYPKYMVPYAFINSFVAQFTAAAMAFMYSPSIVGVYFVTRQLIYVPVTVMASGLRGVLFSFSAKRIASDRESVVDTIYGLSFCIAALVVPATWFAFTVIGDLITILLGEKWKLTGDFARWVLLPSASMMLMSWLDRIYDVFSLQKLNMCVNAGLGVIVPALFYIAHVNSLSPLELVKILSLTLSVFYLCTALILFGCIGVGVRRNFGYVSTVLFLSLFFGALNLANFTLLLAGHEINSILVLAVVYLLYYSLASIAMFRYAKNFNKRNRFRAAA